MFNYLRHFAAISLVLVAVAAWLVGGYFKSVSSEDLVFLVRQNNAALAQGFINTVWKKHHNVIERLWTVEVPTWGNYKEFRNFRDESVRFFLDMPVVEVNIYSPKGELILSTDSSKSADETIARVASDPDFLSAKAGKTSSRILENEKYFLANRQVSEGTLVKTFVPITSDYYVPIIANTDVPAAEAIVELRYNVTSQWDRLSGFQIIATFGVILIFVVLIAVLIITSRRAENIIAKQHEVNLELAATAAAAEAENRDKSQFLANISHELRTPLNAIIGFSEIIKNEPATGLSEQHQEYIRDIHYSGVHLLSLINDILDYSKAEAGKLEVNISEIDGVKMVKNSMRLVIPRAESSQVELVEDLPPRHFTLQTDAKKLKQVLLNLLSNAVKFTPAGGKVTVAAWHDTTKDTVIFTVTDTGIGIALKDISRVMTPFGQVDSTLARRYEGTGLGLPLSKKFVETLGGEFGIQSEVGKGTTVTVTLPRIFNRAAAAAQISASSDPEVL
jgi:two-component system cell cycle sensor histidine kinase PleC